MTDTTTNASRATWSVQYRDAAGFACTLSLTGTDGKTVLERAGKCMEYLQQNGAQPLYAASDAATAEPRTMLRPLAEGQRRILITKLVRTNETQADLYGYRHRYVDTKLFDLSELAAVGIDFANLPIGKPYPCRFFAACEESKKKQKSTGTPYLDVLWLEPAACLPPACAGRQGDAPAFHLDSQVESGQRGENNNAPQAESGARS